MSGFGRRRTQADRPSMHIVAGAVQLLDVHHGRNPWVFYNVLMTIQLEPDLHRKAKLLVAAVQLRKTHGLLYAIRFLEDYGFANVVIWEVLNLIPPGTTKEPSQS
mgnify:CR=1 FL=1